MTPNQNQPEEMPYHAVRFNMDNRGHRKYLSRDVPEKKPILNLQGIVREPRVCPTCGVILTSRQKNFCSHKCSRNRKKGV